MAKTYLQLVNEVLKRVREPSAVTVSASLYSVLVSTYINDAKRVVEDAWMWSSLKAVVNFNLAIGTRTYDLSSTALVGAGNELNERALLLRDPATWQCMAFDVTASSPTELSEVYEHYVNRQIALEGTPTSYQTPMFFSAAPNADSIIISLYETPAAVRNWRMYFKKPQADLVADADTIKVPWLPVVLLATNYALNERGEEIGEPGSQAEQKYMQSLSDAIALDSRNSEQSTTFVVP